MRTLTELSGTLIRLAAKVEWEARRALPKQEEGVSEQVQAEPAKAEASAEAQGAEAKTEETKTEQANPEEAKTEGSEPVELEAVKAALDQAVGTATGIEGDRLARLREALTVVGRRVEDVRRVRVFSAEEPVPGSKKVGEHLYIVDRVSLRPVTKSEEGRDDRKGGRRGDRGGRGDRRGGGGGGDRGGRRGAPGGPGAPGGRPQG